MVVDPGGVTHEVVGADLPPEPPVRTAVIDAHGLLYQRTRWRFWGGIPVNVVEWVGVGERRHAHRPTWPELLSRGPVTIVWRPTDPEPDDDES
jgi:hypothetical protein